MCPHLLTTPTQLAYYYYISKGEEPEMRTNIPAKDIKPGDTLNLEKVTEVKNGNGSVNWKTKESGWMVQPINPNFRVNVER